MTTLRYLACGGASGIGKYTCEQLLNAGHEVVLLDVIAPDFAVTQFIPIDLSDATQTDAALTQLEGEFDGLLNISGVPPREGLTHKIIAINWVGLHYVTQKVLPHIKDHGVIVNLASKAGQFWQDNMAQVKSLLEIQHWDQVADWCEAQELQHVRAYNLSKEVLIVWTKLLAAQLLERHIRVISVSPAAVQTGILDDFAKAFGDKMTANLKTVGRAGKIEEIARVMLFAADPENSWVNGVDIQVDGGMGAAMFAKGFDA